MALPRIHAGPRRRWILQLAANGVAQVAVAFAIT